MNHQRSEVTFSEDIVTTVTRPSHDVSPAPAERGVAQEGNIQAGDDAGAVGKINFKVSSIVHCDFRPELRILKRKNFDGEKSVIFTTKQASFSNLTERKIIKTILVRHHLVF